MDSQQGSSRAATDPPPATGRRAPGAAMRRARASVGRRRRIGQAIAEMHYQLRTEADSPLRVAGSVGLGAAIGCLPVWGIHLPICVGLAKLLGLSRVKAYLAAHIHNPLTLPFLVYLEAATGRWVFTGEWPAFTLQSLRSIDLWTLGRDLLVGTAILGAVSGVLLGAIAYVISVRWQVSPVWARVREAVSKRYAGSGIVHWEFVRGKLRYDPVYFNVLASGMLPSEGRLVDLGSGRGILLALIEESRLLHAAGGWPADWPAPPSGLHLHGVESIRYLVRVARRALRDCAEFQTVDLAGYEPPPARAMILLDVLHHLTPDEQQQLIRRAAAALEPGGLLLVREPDPERGLRFQIKRGVNRAIAFLRRSTRRRPFYYRPGGEWAGLLEREGLTVSCEPRAGMIGSSVLLEARKLAAEA